MNNFLLTATTFNKQHLNSTLLYELLVQLKYIVRASDVALIALDCVHAFGYSILLKATMKLV